MSTPSFACAALIKEIGRGAHGARPLSREDADALYSAMLEERVSDVELGAILIAYRIKGETPAELAGMLSAAHRHLTPAVANTHRFRALSIPSYNGARKQANLTPLLACLLAREGLPVLVHGVRTDPGRVTTAEIFAEMGLPLAKSISEATTTLAGNTPAFVPIDVLSPPLARLLALRKVLGVRNSTHTLVKLLDPFAAPADAPAPGTVRLVNYTHPPYRDSLMGLFTSFPDIAGGDILLARGTEGEAVADTRRQVQIDWLRDGHAEILVEAARRDADSVPAPMPEAADAKTTAYWIKAALQDQALIPAAISRQVDEIVKIARVSKSD